MTSYIITPLVGVIPEGAYHVGAGTRSSVITGLKNGVTYRFAVQAVNVNGMGSMSLTAPTKIGAAPH